MGLEEIVSIRWTCDYCGRMAVLPADDARPPLDWLREDILAFCSIAHQLSYYRKSRT